MQNNILFNAFNLVHVIAISKSSFETISKFDVYFGGDSRALYVKMCTEYGMNVNVRNVWFVLSVCIHCHLSNIFPVCAISVTILISGWKQSSIFPHDVM